MTGLLDRRPGVLALVDPTRATPAAAGAIAAAAAAACAAGLLIGSSFDGAHETDGVARAARQAAPGLPIGLFPGSAMQLTDAVDVILLLCLVSGRNPQYLIEEHVRAVPFLRRHPVPTISTAYLLVDGGRVTSVESVSQTRPLPADKPELAAAHAMAGCLIGMRAVYLEAGSGADRPVAPAVIRACRDAIPGAVPLLVGGGIREPEQAAAARAGGADFIVIGSALEAAADAGAAPLRAFTRAVRP